MVLKDELKKTHDSLSWKINLFFIIACILAALSFVSYIFYALWPNLMCNFFPKDTGEYANAIPMVLASLAGIFFVYIAFLGQRLQMLFQQQEIRDNREEMREANIQYGIQAQALTTQISKMDRDFVHQNFFRILEQHFKTRDRVEFSYKSYAPTGYGEMLRTYTGKIDEAFSFFFRKLLIWVDDKNGWMQDKGPVERLQFFNNYGFEWERRFGENRIGNVKDLKFVPFSDKFNGLTRPQIQFIIRFILEEGIFDTYIRSIFYLLNYVKAHDLRDYFIAIESGMGNYERVFMFYLLTTQFEIRAETDLKVWLMKHNFLYTVKEKELLELEHKRLLYRKEGDLEIPL